jgi:hypothetical protein
MYTSSSSFFSWLNRTLDWQDNQIIIQISVHQIGKCLSYPVNHVHPVETFF